MLAVAVLIFYIGVDIGFTLQHVRIEFLYHNPFCLSCAAVAPTIPEQAITDYQVYKHYEKVLMDIQISYGDKVIVEWIEFFSEEGRERARRYGLSFEDSNSIVVNKERVFVGGDKFVNETQLRETIDSYLALPETSDSGSTTSLAGVLITALSLGFFESFSPCVIIMLSFIVSYALSDMGQLRGGFLKVLIFGVGFVAASAVLLTACALLFFLIPSLQFYLMLIACSFAIVFGLNLLGVIRLLERPKSKVRRIAEKRILSYVGIFFLGFIFYFLDPCIAPIFASMTAVLFAGTFIFALSFFCLGAIVPFVGIGVFVGSISKVTRKVYKHRFVFRILSGFILIGCALYLILTSTLIY